MPWNAYTTMSLRHELVLLADQPGANLAEIARRFGVSRKTAHKWRARYRAGGVDALVDLPRTPHRSPNRTPPDVEAAVLRVRDAHPVWGPRKISARLTGEGIEAPAPATVTAVLRRHGRLGKPVPHLPMVRSRPPRRGGRPRRRTTSGRWTTRATSSSATRRGASR